MTKLQRMMTEETIKTETQSIAFIDRIENKFAVLIFSDETSLDVPLNQLPKNAQAGDFLDVTFDAHGKAITFAPNVQETEITIERVTELQAELQASNDADQMNITL